MKVRWIILPVALAALMSGIQLYAHHSFAATYFEDKQQTVEGDLVQFLFRNPVPRKKNNNDVSLLTIAKKNRNVYDKNTVPKIIEKKRNHPLNIPSIREKKDLIQFDSDQMMINPKL